VFSAERIFLTHNLSLLSRKNPMNQFSPGATFGAFKTLIDFLTTAGIWTGNVSVRLLVQPVPTGPAPDPATLVEASYPGYAVQSPAGPVYHQYGTVNVRNQEGVQVNDILFPGFTAGPQPIVTGWAVEWAPTVGEPAVLCMGNFQFPIAVPASPSHLKLSTPFLSMDDANFIFGVSVV
jgi:hypothetical protein